MNTLFDNIKIEVQIPNRKWQHKQTCSVPLKFRSLPHTTLSADQRRDEIMFTLTKKKHNLHPKNELGKQASGAASEVENYSSHKESAQKARILEDTATKSWP